MEKRPKTYPSCITPPAPAHLGWYPTQPYHNHATTNLNNDPPPPFPKNAATTSAPVVKIREADAVVKRRRPHDSTKRKRAWTLICLLSACAAVSTLVGVMFWGLMGGMGGWEGLLGGEEMNGTLREEHSRMGRENGTVD